MNRYLLHIGALALITQISDKLNESGRIISFCLVLFIIFTWIYLIHLEMKNITEQSKQLKILKKMTKSSQSSPHVSSLSDDQSQTDETSSKRSEESDGEDDEKIRWSESSSTSDDERSAYFAWNGDSQISSNKYSDSNTKEYVKGFDFDTPDKTSLGTRPIRISPQNRTPKNHVFNDHLQRSPYNLRSHSKNSSPVD